MAAQGQVLASEIVVDQAPEAQSHELTWQISKEAWQLVTDDCRLEIVESETTTKQSPFRKVIGIRHQGKATLLSSKGSHG